MRLGTAGADKPSLQDLLQQYGLINYHLIQSARDRVQGRSRDQVLAPRQQWGKALTLIRNRKMHALPENADMKNNLPTTQRMLQHLHVLSHLPCSNLGSLIKIFLKYRISTEKMSL